jgi:uncharacterized membrane protein YphA (DoxX/SURF4 family)
MASTVKRTLLYLPNLYLGLQLLYSGFSRFTNGRFTPEYYEWQLAHQSVDSVQSGSDFFDNIIIPSTDIVLGLSLLLARPRTAFIAAAIVAAFMCLGLALMVQNGEDWTHDLILLIAALAAAASSKIRTH